MPARQRDRRAEGFRARRPAPAREFETIPARPRRLRRSRSPPRPRCARGRLDRGDWVRMELGVANEPDDRLDERVDVVRVAIEAEGAPYLQHGRGFRRDAGFCEPRLSPIGPRPSARLGNTAKAALP